MVKPKLSKILKKYSVGDESSQAENELWDGENLSTVVTLYKHRGQVDLIVTDPPVLTVQELNWLLDGFDLLRNRPHQVLTPRFVA